MQYFDRKIYTLIPLLKDLAWLIFNVFNFYKAKKSGKITKAFIEKIMLVTTAVNGCVYCAWFHAKMALKSGIEREEVNKLLNLQFNLQTSEYETVALLYAQHYAETNRKVDKEMQESLINFYGEKTAKEIILYIRAIYFGNLSGNTFDAFLSRLDGKKAKNSNVIFEFVFFIFAAPILWPTMPYVKKYRK
ncbi:MAG: carboxymuconolactone decarboxylase family protein [Bacteroidales bacterium]|nr:carboxymuconolactone decarboxylase family protein [Bacteroidales bacterium]MBN2755569.1 carboxymuconolactone decarboxylase family protein [Bacteroidales bacterium]